MNLVHPWKTFNHTGQWIGSKAQRSAGDFHVDESEHEPQNVAHHSAHASADHKPVKEVITMPLPLDQTFNGVVDLSHHNNRIDLAKAAQNGIVGVIQKASQGQSYVDPTFKGNRTKAANAGLLWGAYHFGTGADGLLQADHFLDVVQPDQDTLLVLDFEANPQGPNMTLIEARAFVTHLRETTGRWPGLYSGHYIKALLGTQTDPVLANCWFWLSQYGPTPVVPTNWSQWTMWQYTDGGVGPEPHSVAGIGRCDRDRYNGTEAELRAFWSAS